MEVWKKSELLKEKTVSTTLGVLMLKPSRSFTVISSTSAERPPPEPPPQVVVSIPKGRLLLRPPPPPPPPPTLQKTEFCFSSLELGTERPPWKPPWVIYVCFESLSLLRSNCWYHTSFIGLYENESSFTTFAHQLIFVQHDKVNKSETKV
ncbi:hypothetical protein MtrunA17_Chr5g0422901 [Medicago truncatula]|uniref:Uncharacterized protein n=1 Tax=Medicago truncatula TaxID=3880 RepID=A0A396HR82_MEDTR|nr:hypothetical protein MtrunA17_Chr5g0422901 [Medicago truncatula]